MELDLPDAPAVERNREPILDHLERLLASSGTVLEIGSGTGQHAVFFGQKLPHLRWQTSDLESNHSGIDAWIQRAGLSNVLPPLGLDVRDQGAWPDQRYDAVFSANALHIMSWPAAQAMLSQVGRALRLEGLLILYGPFNYGGNYSSESNRDFDGWLKQRDPQSAIRDFEAVEELLNGSGLYLAEDNPMPANNRLLVFAKSDDI